jgi:hypothetical protein
MHKRNVWVAAIRRRAVNADTKEQREQNEVSEPHLTTKRTGWIGGFGSACGFAIEWLCF